MARLMLFVFPPHAEHPESTGRLEVFARYGPTDEQGQLPGGVGGGRMHTERELRLMIAHETRSALRAAFPKPPVEAILDELMHIAASHRITARELRRLLQHVPTDEDGLMNFSAMQEVILEHQRKRMRELVELGAAARKERGPKVPFQSKVAQTLLAPLQKKALSEAEGHLATIKRLHAGGSLVSSLEDQNNAAQINANVLLSRPLGGVEDRWDRYCAVRRGGKASHVQARNTPRCAALDGGQGDRHGGCSSLVAAGLHR